MAKNCTTNRNMSGDVTYKFFLKYCLQVLKTSFKKFHSVVKSKQKLKFCR